MLAARGGRLGFNLKILIETSEESGSPGLAEFCARHREELAADLLIRRTAREWRPPGRRCSSARGARPRSRSA